MAKWYEEVTNVFKPSSYSSSNTGILRGGILGTIIQGPVGAMAGAILGGKKGAQNELAAYTKRLSSAQVNPEREAEEARKSYFKTRREAELSRNAMPTSGGSILGSSSARQGNSILGRF